MDVVQLLVLIQKAQAQYEQLHEVYNELGKGGAINTSLGKTGAIDSSIENEMKELQGSYGMGTNNPNKFVNSWGSDSESWQDALNMAGNGGSEEGALGTNVSEISGDFPINTTTFNKVDSSVGDQKYYKLQAETALAARAASQLDYGQIQKQIDYQKTLQSQIDTTKNVKAAIDLQNRLQVEHNLINLELLRQISLSNQQKAVASEAEVNGENKNAQFLSQ